MGEDKKIVVKRGAKLIVDNGTITNTCGARWGGIEVWGNTAVAHKDLFLTTLIPTITVKDYENLHPTRHDHSVVILKK
ncbi:MAG: hypothetical protein IPN94_17455 [Sphingobacteriales bacterium]|nr:hypothetical protein [Sphingobacteriales bacterium]